LFRDISQCNQSLASAGERLHEAALLVGNTITVTTAATRTTKAAAAIEAAADRLLRVTSALVASSDPDPAVAKGAETAINDSDKGKAKSDSQSVKTNSHSDIAEEAWQGVLQAMGALNITPKPATKPETETADACVVDGRVGGSGDGNSHSVEGGNADLNADHNDDDDNDKGGGSGGSGGSGDGDTSGGDGGTSGGDGGDDDDDEDGGDDEEHWEKIDDE
jgi:hypothetical protein